MAKLRKAQDLFGVGDDNEKPGTNDEETPTSELLRILYGEQNFLTFPNVASIVDQDRKNRVMRYRQEYNSRGVRRESLEAWSATTLS